MVCTTVTVSEALTCGELQPDSWKVATINPKSGDDLQYIIKTKLINQSFEIRLRLNDSGAPTIYKGVSDSQGCYKGTIPAQPDGKYVIRYCYPGLLSCPEQSPVTVTWGKLPMSLEEMVLWGVGGLCFAYLLGSFISRGGKR